MERFLIDAEGFDSDAVNIGCSWLIDYAASAGHAKAAIYIPEMRSASSLPESFRQLASSRREARTVRKGGVLVGLATARDVDAARGVPVLALWVVDTDIEKLGTVAMAALCVVPWMGAATLRWIRAHSVTDLQSGRTTQSRAAIENPVVERAMELLHEQVNLANGFGEPNRRIASEILFALVDRGETFDPEELEAWASAHGWRADLARRLEEHASKVIVGSTRRPRQTLRDDLVARWQQEVRENR